MIELRTKTTIQKIPSMSLFGESFRSKIIFFLQSDEFDERGILPTCAIADFQKGEIRYVHSLLPENLALLDREDPGKTRFSLYKAGNDPHGALKVSETRFLVSFQYAKVFLDFDLESETVTVREDADLFDTPLEGVQFWATFFKTPEKTRNGKQYFYLVRGGKRSDPNDFVLEYYAVASDLSESWLVQRKAFDHPPYPPHVVREFGNRLFQSHFLHIGFRISSTGETYPNRTEFLKRAYSDLEKLYRSTEIGRNDPTTALYTMDMQNPKIQFFGRFEHFIDRLREKLWMPDFFELVDRLFWYGVELLPGHFGVWDLATGEEFSYETSSGRAAHIEFDETNGRAYFSSHNFDTTLYGNVIAYFWPAKIDRFDLSEDGGLVKMGTFSDPKGFRFTSHKVFRNGNRTFLCTIGHPGRLFFADAETMRLEYFSDILPSRLSELSWDSLLWYVKRANPGKNDGFLRPLEASEDGKYVFIPWRDVFFVFDFEKRTVCERFPKMDVSVSENLSLSDFKQVGAHCQYLE